MSGGLWGYINEEGQYAIQPTFDSADFFGENGLAVVQTGGYWGYINSQGEFVIEPTFDDAYNFTSKLH